MKKNKIALLIAALTIVSTLGGYTIINNYTTTNNINNLITTYMNNNYISNIATPTTDDSTKTLTKTNSESDGNAYIINILNIKNTKLTKIDNEDNFYTYAFKAQVSLSNDINEFEATIESQIILEKNDTGFIVKSTDDFISELNKSIIDVKKNNNEDISDELSANLLVYTNDKLDISLKYPDYYSLSNNTTFDNNSIDDNITIYFSDEKTNNYLNMKLLQRSNHTLDESIDRYVSQGYTELNETFTTTNNISFKIFTQSFIQDNAKTTECILISKDDYKNIDSIQITLRVHENNLSGLYPELTEILNSIQ